MAFRYVYRNAARGATTFGDSAGGALGTAVGFAAGDLVDGTVGRSWRSSASSASHTLAIALANDSWDFVSVFDCRATDGTIPSDVEFFAGPSISGPWTSVASGAPNARGDIGGGLSASPDVYLKIEVTFSGAKTLRIGEVFAGKAVTLTRTFAERRDTHRFPVIENETQSGDVSRVAMGKRARVIQMRWDAMSESSRDEIETMLDAFGSQSLPCVLVPDTATVSEIFHGWMPPSWSEDVDDPIRSEISLTFREDGRGV